MIVNHINQLRNNHFSIQSFLALEENRMANLTLEWTGEKSKSTKDLSEHTYAIIGRQDECDIVLSDPHVSGRHAVIFYDGGTFRLHNLSQTNPIVLNDQWVLSFGHNIPIHMGDGFEVGNIKVQVTDYQQSKNVQTWQPW
jgi:predicted component of type VI protein secretion system